MKMIYRIPVNMMRATLLLSVVSALLSLCACAGDKERLPEEVRRVVEAAKSDSPEQFAAICAYPVERPYPLRDVTDAAEMKDYYKILVDDSLRNALSKASAKAWSNLGWRGWTLDDGKYIWIDSAVYSIPYISKAELQLIQSLSDDEMRTLPPDLRKGWHPATCLRAVDDGTVYRIDMADDNSISPDSLYRICIYLPGKDLRDTPSYVMKGNVKLEGSAGVRTFYFRNSNGDSLEYSPDEMEEEEPDVIWKPADGSPVSFKVAKAYWRDLLDKPLM